MSTKRILILTEAIDITADKVCQWLYYYKAEFLRLNTDIDDVWVHSIEINKTKVLIKIGHKFDIYDLSEFSLIWFRRGMLVNKVREVKNNLFPEDDLINNQINAHLNQELRALNDFVFRHVPKIATQINNPSKYNINKLECLLEAAKRGLKTPYTLITNRRATVAALKKKTPIITKNISEILICHSDHFFMSQSTLPIRDKDMRRVNDTFFPSLFQEAIVKRADIRVFFFLGRIFSTAVYCSTDNELIDFRGSDQIFIVPFDLPKQQTEMLLDLAESLGLESGSADFLLTLDDQLIFLEINPVGQIDFVSHLSNLYIEKEIAKILIEHATVN